MWLPRREDDPGKRVLTRAVVAGSCCGGGYSWTSGEGTVQVEKDRMMRASIEGGKVRDEAHMPEGRSELSDRGAKNDWCQE